MKSTVLRIFPSWCVILILKFLIGIDYSILSVAETVVVAFVWAGIHEMLGNKTSLRVLRGAVFVFVTGTVLTILYKPCPIIIRIIMIAIGVYMLKVALEEISTIELRNSDNSKRDPYAVTNIFGVKVILRYIDAMEHITQKGAKELGTKAKWGYQGISPSFKNVFYKLLDMKYQLFRIAPDKTLVYGRDGIAILRTIDEAGDYEFKDGKWYKDGKKCTDFNKEASRILKRLSGEYGTNKVILVKTFEGGNINGSGCGMYVTDITRGDKKLIEAVEKITRVEYIANKAEKKSFRISKALLSVK